jgi:DNA-binding SARP family transcriptional activator
MEVETESQRLEDEYRSALKRYDDSRAAWQADPLAVSVEELLALDELGPPHEACGEAMAALDRWRAYRAAHGLP